MKRYKSFTILNFLLFSIAIMLSGNVFAVKPQKPSAIPIYEIGKTGPAGGIVFHISDGGGNRVRGHHGLEVAPVDQGMAAWGCYATEITGANGAAIGTGAKNTTDILTGCTEPGIAAELATNYELNGYTDWFLPSLEELNLIRRNLFPLELGGFLGGYWTSTEVSTTGDSGFAWANNFDYDNSPQVRTPTNTQLMARAVRAF
ncbi:hypothetical protein Nit79A3_2752 [Nitrosomonas sp. Is79A3]|uniref:DUF1566 domain-containing protein n=1 Tax=Nitrosomonas sp. (strain Is79A3) TaxID=261292 RepID=UPI000215D20F